jgi:hypothetical protein
MIGRRKGFREEEKCREDSFGLQDWQVFYPFVYS